MFAKLAKHSARHAARSILGAGLYEKIQFRRHTGYPLDIDDPKTWNEKLTVRKLDRSFNDALILQDTYASRKLVERKWSAMTRWLAVLSPSALTPVKLSLAPISALNVSVS